MTLLCSGYQSLTLLSSYQVEIKGEGSQRFSLYDNGQVGRKKSLTLQ